MKFNLFPKRKVSIDRGPINPNDLKRTVKLVVVYLDNVSNATGRITATFPGLSKLETEDAMEQLIADDNLVLMDEYGNTKYAYQFNIPKNWELVTKTVDYELQEDM